jgi:two-component system, chemotaxis family, chemotaxis protein CheY
VLTTGNRLPPFWIIDLRGGSGYLRVISPHKRITLARKILLADDSVTAQNMGRKILADAGYEVITVNNGSAALKKIAEQKPDLIVLDVYMPGYSGLEVCQRLKEAQETSRVPVLLTVGKLEPFKPEEARRARADGFIVKPFEASELLSALSKLEDKIVPRSESSKPGRFARATAALEEGRYDKSVAIEEDSGWKNRIAFPPKKKDKSAEEDGDDSAIYNAMNKDLRTVVEHKPEDTPHETKVEEAKVDLGALAPEGLPKDVTPEEIAALAAAAAQVKSKIAEVEPEADSKAEHKAETLPSVERPQEIGAAQPSVATFADQKSEEKIEAAGERPGDAPKEGSSSVAPSPADVMAAISALESESGASHAANSGNGSWLHGATNRTTDEPVTMAVAAGSGSAVVTSRWRAVSVALAPEEGAISLEQEMQKACAAPTAEGGPVGNTAPVAESKPVFDNPTPATETVSPVETSHNAEASVAAVSPIPEPEPVQASNATAGVATEAISSAVQELEAVAASYAEQMAPAAVEPEIAPVEKFESAPPTAPEAPSAAAEKTVTEFVTENSVPAESEAPQSEAAQTDVPQASEESNRQKDEEPKIEASKIEVPTPVAAATMESEESSGKNADTVEAPIVVNEVPSEQIPESPVSDNANGDSDASETTAAAWASWRRNRESGVPVATSAEPAKHEVEHETSSPEDAAARAVAAGAEKAPEDAAANAPSEVEGIESIVDSVLADLRPKIYEEISRKMGKKR